MTLADYRIEGSALECIETESLAALYVRIHQLCLALAVMTTLLIFAAVTVVSLSPGGCSASYSDADRAQLNTLIAPLNI